MFKISKRGLAAIIAAVLIIVGFCMAKYAESGAGAVDVRRTEFLTSDGHRMSAKLYIPKNATAETPAPAILAAPGGNANLENLSDPCIELSRRGFVVMAFDPYTIGRSDSVDAPGNGAREAMKYMRSLAFVDNENIGAFGHSAGNPQKKQPGRTRKSRKIMQTPSLYSTWPQCQREAALFHAVPLHPRACGTGVNVIFLT